MISRAQDNSKLVKHKIELGSICIHENLHEKLLTQEIIALYPVRGHLNVSHRSTPIRWSEFKTLQLSRPLVPLEQFVSN